MFSIVSEVPVDVYLLEDCPHDWLFPRCTAVVCKENYHKSKNLIFFFSTKIMESLLNYAQVHHGGAGTTATGLRAGVIL